MDTIQRNKTEVVPEQAPIEMVAPESTSQDIVSRVSKAVKLGPTGDKFQETQQSIEEFKSFEQEINKIQDPMARQLLETQYKNMVKGMNEKFRTVAELKKDLEEKQSQYQNQSQASDTWTRERLQAELNKPDFTQAVQEYAQQVAPQEWSGTQQEWSTLTDNEKREFSIIQNKVGQLEASQRQFQQQQIDQQIKSSYEDYDPTIINEFESKLRRGNVDDRARRELIYKALKYDDHVKRSYELAMQDKSSGISEKMNASSNFDSNGTQTPALDVPKRAEGQSSKNHFLEIAKRRINQLQNK